MYSRGVSPRIFNGKRSPPHCPSPPGSTPFLWGVRFAFPKENYPKVREKILNQEPWILNQIGTNISSLVF